MFNIGGTELLLILVIAFVVVGPKDLPKVARALGRAVRKIAAFTKELKKETGFDEVEKELKGVTSDLKQVGTQVCDTLKDADVTQDLRKELTQIKKEAGSAVNLARKETAASAGNAARATSAEQGTPAKPHQSLGFKEFAEKARQSRSETAAEKAVPAEETRQPETPAAEAGDTSGRADA